jgi:hypothetical protein
MQLTCQREVRSFVRNLLKDNVIRQRLISPLREKSKCRALSDTLALRPGAFGSKEGSGARQRVRCEIACPDDFEARHYAARSVHLRQSALEANRSRPHKLQANAFVMVIGSRGGKNLRPSSRMNIQAPRRIEKAHLEAKRIVTSPSPIVKGWVEPGQQSYGH